MRDIYKIFDKLAGTKSIVSFHYKSFPVRPFCLTIHDKDHNCFAYQADTLEDLERQVVVEWKHLLTPSMGMPVPIGFPTP